MLTEKFDMNVLGPILPLFYHRTDIDMQIRCAKMFGALKNSATALKEYYELPIPQSFFVDARFPWITQYDTITTPTETREYKYLRQMDGHTLLYICQHIHDQKRILVKFVQTYSKDAHLAPAAKDGAPTLLGHRDVLSCGWSVVVMELLEEVDWVSGLKISESTEQHMVCDKVREHVHRQGFVHGDIRPQNVLVKHRDTGHGVTLSVRLVDFDWAGETNKVKYPFHVNPDLGYGLKRPSGVKGGGIITTEHDLAMVELMYLWAHPQPKVTSGRKRSLEGDGVEQADRP
jgi:serine/threonine protein kinase